MSFPRGQSRVKLLGLHQEKYMLKASRNVDKRRNRPVTDRVAQMMNFLLVTWKLLF